MALVTPTKLLYIQLSDSLQIYCLGMYSKPFRPDDPTLYPQQDGKFVWAKITVMWNAARKVTVCLASHWPCITDSALCPPKGQMV